MTVGGERKVQCLPAMVIAMEEETEAVVITGERGNSKVN